MKLSLLSILLGISISFSLNAQTYCTTELSADERIEYAKNLQQLRYAPTNLKATPDSLPIKLHIVSKDDGTAGIKHSAIFAAIDQLNMAFIDITRFYICKEIDYVNETQFYYFNEEDEENLAASRDQIGAINLYLVHEIENGTKCGYTYLPRFTQNDRIFIGANDCFTQRTLEHEMGHFFGLLHPYSGSYCGMGELVDGSNCETAGDMLCDTPADPIIATNQVDSFCNYTGTCTDANGDRYTPLTNNFMSGGGFSYRCNPEFTPQQKELMIVGITQERNRLIPDFCEPLQFTSIKENQLEKVKVYPNPGKNNLTITGLQGNEWISITNLLGKEILKTQATKSEKHTLNIHSETGIYFVEIRNEKEAKTIKWLKE